MKAKKLFKIIIIFLLLSFSLSCSSLFGGGSVEFADSNLEKYIRGEIDKWDGEIYSSDLVDIDELSFIEKGVEDISGLEYCVNLDTVNLSLNRIKDISPLAKLKNLKYLYIEHNKIEDISALSKLKELIILHAYNNKIKDILALSKLTNLEQLYIDNNQISDISILSNLTNMESINIGNNQISDISSLAGLNQIVWLGAGRNQISDISPLSTLTELVYLDLSNNKLSDISSLAMLENIETLHLWKNQISDVSPLTNLPELKNLYLWNNNITDGSPFEEMENLEDLFIRNNNITNLSEEFKNKIGRYYDKQGVEAFKTKKMHTKAGKVPEELIKKVFDEPAEYEKNLRAVVDYLTKDVDSVCEKVKLIHDWICINLSYDYDVINNKRSHADGDIPTILERKQCVCLGYSVILKELSGYAGIKIWLVGGLGRTGIGDEPEGHAWNAMMINDKWYCIDTTWNDGGSKGSTYWLYMKPEHFIYTHYPQEDSIALQFLDEPFYSEEEFESLPKVTDNFIEFDANLYSPRTRSLTKESTQLFKIYVPNADEMVISVSGDIIPLNKNDENIYTLEYTIPENARSISIKGKFNNEDKYSGLVSYRVVKKDND